MFKLLLLYLTAIKCLGRASTSESFMLCHACGMDIAWSVDSFVEASAHGRMSQSRFGFDISDCIGCCCKECLSPWPFHSIPQEFDKTAHYLHPMFVLTEDVCDRSPIPNQLQLTRCAAAWPHVCMTLCLPRTVVSLHGWSAFDVTGCRL